MALMKGVAKASPASQPKYDSFWSLDALMEHIRRMPRESRTQKRAAAVVLVKLAILGRSADISKIMESSLVFSETGASFKMKGLKGHSTEVSAPVPLPRLEDRNICAVFALQDYLDDLKSYRGDAPIAEVGLFRGVCAPFEVIKATTLAVITKKVLFEAGIDVSKYGAHSTRGAVASAALEAGCPIDQVLAAGRWSSSSTFNKHYNRSDAWNSVWKALAGPLPLSSNTPSLLSSSSSTSNCSGSPRDLDGEP